MSYELPNNLKSNYFYDSTKDVIGLDLITLWKNSESFDDFVKYFNEIYTHELIHREIKYELGNIKPSIGQEKICVALTTNDWDEEYDEFYRGVYK